MNEWSYDLRAAFVGVFGLKAWLPLVLALVLAAGAGHAVAVSAGAVPAAADGFFLEAPLLVAGPCDRSLDEALSAPPFFLLEVVLLEAGLVFFFLGLLSLGGETGVRLRGDRRKVVTLRPSEDPVKTEATVVLWDKLTVVAVPAVAVPAVALPAVAVTAVPAVAVPAVAVPAVAGPAVARLSGGCTASTSPTTLRMSRGQCKKKRMIGAHAPTVPVCSRYRCCP